MRQEDHDQAISAGRVDACQLVGLNEVLAVMLLVKKKYRAEIEDGYHITPMSAEYSFEMQPGSMEIFSFTELLTCCFKGKIGEEPEPTLEPIKFESLSRIWQRRRKGIKDLLTSIKGSVSGVK